MGRCHCELLLKSSFCIELVPGFTANSNFCSEIPLNYEVGLIMDPKGELYTPSAQTTSPPCAVNDSHYHLTHGAESSA